MFAIKLAEEGDMHDQQGVSRREMLRGAAGLSTIVVGMLTGGCELFQLTTQRIRNRPIRRNLASRSITHIVPHRH